MPFLDPHSGSTEADSLPRRFQELELPDPYIWLYTTVVSSTFSGAAGLDVTWTTCVTDTSFGSGVTGPAGGFDPNISSSSPIIPVSGLYSLSFHSTGQKNFAGEAIAVNIQRIPYNSTTPQTLITGRPNFDGTDFDEFLSICLPFVGGDQVKVTFTNITGGGGLFVGGQSYRTFLILAGLGQSRRQGR